MIRCLQVTIGIVTVICVTTVSAAAQTITMPNIDSARAGLRVGYGGQGVDLDVSIDSPRLAGAFRLRAGIGHGHWLGINSNSNEPRVTRLAASALFFFAPSDLHDLPAYVGIGIGAFVPHDDGFRTRMGVRLTLGMEVSGDRWTVGPELEFDATRGRLDQLVRKDLLPTFRVGLAVRRRF